MNNKFAFLSSVRFWKLFLVGVSAGLLAYDPTNQIIIAITSMISVWLGSSVVVGTVDKFSQKNNPVIINGVSTTTGTDV